MDSSGPRSTLIDYTYQHIDNIISGQRDGTRPDQLEKILEHRIQKLRNLTEPFGKPSEASKKKVDGGSVELSDGVKINVLDVDKEVIFEISSHFKIDEVDALILLRSFLYNEGLPPIPDSGSTSSLVKELLIKITPFYFSERLHVPRVVMCLLRAHQSLNDPFHRVAVKILPKIISEPTSFVETLVVEYRRKSRLPVPDHAINEPKAASQWAKQNAKEQLGILELLFSALWDFVPCIASVVVAVFEAAYSGKFGYEQANSTSMLDEEGQQVQRDLSAIWLLLTIEVLNLEQIGSPGLELSEDGSSSSLLASSPQALAKIHALVMSHSSAGYTCTMLAWAFYLKGICDAASQMAERPQAYVSFLREIRASCEVSHRKGEKELHHLIVANVLSPESGIFSILSELLTQSPFFSTPMAGKTGSAVSEPNSVSYRALVKGLLISLLDYEPVELIPDYEGLVNVWIALFSVSEKAAVAGICRQYWDFDWRQGKNRRAIIDVARQRFPIQPRPLIRLLRAMTGAGFIETSESLKINDQDNIDLDHQICSAYVFHYFLMLPSYTQVIPVPLKSGANALFDRIIDRGPGNSRGAVYTNAKPVILPGGSTLTQKSIGRLLSPDSSSEPVVVAWQHEHSGWKLIVELFVDFITRRLGSSRVPTTRIDSVLSRRDANITLQLDDVGLERDANEELVIADALELVLSIIQGNPALTSQLMESLEIGGSPVSFVSKDSIAPDLVQVIFMILEDALSKAQNRRQSPSPLVSPAIGILSALLSVPTYSNRVWLFLRSTSMLFGSERDPQFSSAVLATERSTGNYKMTISLLRLVRNLFEEAVTSLLTTQSEQPRLQAIKEEVLLRAIRFVQGQIWAEHSGWRFARLGDKYEIGTQVTALYSQVMETMSAVSSANTFSSLSEYVTGITIHNATTSTIAPLVNSIASGRSVLDTLVKLRRFSEARQFTKLLENSLCLIRLILNVKQVSSVAKKMTLLEQTLCSDISIANTLLRTHSVRVNCVDTLSWYIRERDLGTKIPLEAVKALTSLCSSISACGPSAPSLIGLFADPIATMRSLVKIVTHPYDELALRNAIWAFMSIVVEKQQALAVLFISGQLTVQADRIKGKEKATDSSSESPQDANSVNAVEAASRTLTGWEALWDSNPQLLASVLSFLDMVWTHSLEHAIALKSTKIDLEFWKRLSRIVTLDAGPAPDYVVTKEVDSDEGRRSEFHDAASNHSYRLKAKGHALRVIGSEVAREGSLRPNFIDIKSQLLNKDGMLEAFAEASISSYDPMLYDNLVSAMQSSFGSISIQSLKSVEPLYEREFGDNFVFSIPLLRAVVSSALAVGGQNGSDAESLKLLAYSVNLNLTLAHAQLLLIDAWCTFLEKTKGYLAEGPSNSQVRTVYLSAAAAVIRDVACERRTGEFMCAIHGSRLRLLVSILEVAWFSPVESSEQTQAFMELVDELDGVIKSETFPPAKSFLGTVSTPFHRPLLQIVYFCARNCQNIVRESKTLKADHRIVMGRTLTSALLLVIDALRLSFDTARTRIDVELDKDMELLVAVFQQCTRSGLNASSISWLTKCQEADVISASLSLIAQADISGFSDLTLLRTRGQPLYSPHVLSFHMALASIPFSAERMASEGLVSAYCSNSVTPALSEGAVDVTLPELPSERSPVHRAYCLMLANLVGIICHLTSPQQFVESQVVGFVQLYGKQLSRTLSWTNDDPLTLPLLEELELSTELFYLMAKASSSKSEPSLSSVLQIFTEHALLLLQQLNYGLSHPKHLAGLLDPVTADDRIRIDRETNDLTVNSLSDLLEVSVKPLMTSVVRRLFGLAAKVLSTLTVLSNADSVLTSDPEEWSLKEALIVPHSKVTMGEPASIGTLLELGNCTHETLQFLNQKYPTATTTREKEVYLSTIRIVRQTLECDLVYASTQLIMWLTKHDGEQGGDMEIEEQQDISSYGHKAAENNGGPKDRDRERRMRRKSLTLADRLRRGMTGEMTMDLQALVGKATPVVSKSTELMGSSDTTDIMPILSGFLEERVIPQ